jgi:hypothetical protein
MNIERPTSNVEREKMKKQEGNTTKLYRGAQRHHYSMFDVERSMLGVQLSSRPTAAYPQVFQVLHHNGL